MKKITITWHSDSAEYSVNDPCWDGGEVYLASEADAEIAARDARIRKLQVALEFWLPMVPADDDEIAQRAGDDSFLLLELEGEIQPDAQELGWIQLRKL